MNYQQEKYTRRRITTSYFTTVVSITLVLLMIGLLGMIILQAKQLSDYVKENIGFSVMINEGVKEVTILELQKQLDKEPYIKSTKYITREQAAAEFSEELGEDFVSFLGYNPLLPSLELKLRADYATSEQIQEIEARLLSMPEVKEVGYQKPLIDQINRNVERIGLIISGFTLLLLFISIALINNTIRLSVYAKRFLIRSMQLVGATQGFIQKPFIIRGILHGLISGLMAVGMLMLVVYFTIQEIPELIDFVDIRLIFWLFLSVIVMGILISWISTYFAVRKYLWVKTDHLYS